MELRDSEKKTCTQTDRESWGVVRGRLWVSLAKLLELSVSARHGERVRLPKNEELTER